MLPTVEDDELLAALWVAGFHQSGSLASKLVLELGYNIDYEDEKESFEVDEADTVELVNGERMPWEQVKRDGIDYIALYYVNDKGKQVQILDAELA